MVQPAHDVAADPFQVMPPLSDDELAALHEDVAAHGVRVPVIRDQYGRVIDGHHRVRVAEELGVDYPVEVVEVTDDDHARQVARTVNLARRHLTRAQRRDLVADELTADPDRSDRAIGRLLGVDHKTVGSVRRELAGEVPHQADEHEHVPTLPELAEFVYACVVIPAEESPDDEERDGYSRAVQIADSIREWADDDRPNCLWWALTAPAAYRAELPVGPWRILNHLLLPMARLALEEIHEIREDRGAPDGWTFPGERLARLHLSVWADHVTDELVPAMFAALDAQVVAAVCDADRLVETGEVRA